MSTRNIVKNNPVSGQSSYWNVDENTLTEITVFGSKLRLIQLARAFIFTGDSTVVTPITQNVYSKFLEPTGGYQVARSHLITVDSPNSRFTYTGVGDRWFRIIATCSIQKAVAGVTDTYGFIWYKNGIPLGTAKLVDATNTNFDIVSGEGQVLMSPNDYLEPHVTNIDGSNGVIARNCTFDIKEDPTFIWGSHDP